MTVQDESGNHIHSFAMCDDSIDTELLAIAEGFKTLRNLFPYLPDGCIQLDGTDQGDKIPDLE
jgi:hypothetical protein